MDRNWMYDGNNPGKRGQVKDVFKMGVEFFINTVKHNLIVIREGGIRCPCVVCGCTCMRSEDEIRVHLYNKGFQPNYWVWSSHGESMSTSSVPVNQGVSSSGIQSSIVPQNYQHYDPFNEMNDMITNALGFNVPNYVPNEADGPIDDDEYDGDVNIEQPNEEARRFFYLLKETNKPLFEGSLDSKLSVCIRLLGVKSQNVSKLTMDLITKLMLDITTDSHDDMPKSYYQAKQLVAKLGLGVKRIDCCVNGCMLYYNNEFGVSDGALLECKFCHEPRYRVAKNSRSSRRKPVPRKAMFYLPIIPRLQRLYFFFV
ncbi:hypothetical protein P8452_16742 [Trifolium repens]|nr:hypothetical protein P8452_16742 [Trifolium repens]